MNRPEGEALQLSPSNPNDAPLDPRWNHDDSLTRHNPVAPKEARMDKIWKPWREMMGYTRYASRAEAPNTKALVFDPEPGDPNPYDQEIP